jgi:hypothetical protein
MASMLRIAEKLPEVKKVHPETSKQEEPWRQLCMASKDERCDEHPSDYVQTGLRKGWNRHKTVSFASCVAKATMLLLGHARSFQQSVET